MNSPTNYAHVEQTQGNIAKTLWTELQHIGQPRRDGLISRNIQATETESWKKKNLNRQITSKEIKLVTKNLPTKVQDQVASLVKSTKHLVTKYSLVEIHDAAWSNLCHYGNCATCKLAL